MKHPDALEHRNAPAAVLGGVLAGLVAAYVVGFSLDLGGRAALGAAGVVGTTFGVVAYLRGASIVGRFLEMLPWWA